MRAANGAVVQLRSRAGFSARITDGRRDVAGNVSLFLSIVRNAGGGDVASYVSTHGG